MTLERAMRQVLAELQLLQYGKTQSFNAAGGRSENPDPRPSGESRPLADHWRDEWTREPSERTLTAARAELATWKKRQAPAVDVDPSLEDLVLEDGQGYAAEQVASRFGIAVSRVVRIRLRASSPRREAEFGMPVDGLVVKDSSRERVVNLARQGCTLRQIAVQTDVPRETVRRWMKEAA
jgi:hypothetical protein